MAKALTDLDEYPHLSPAYRPHTEHSHGYNNSRGDRTRTPEEEQELTELTAPAPAPTSQRERRGSALEAGEIAMRRGTRCPKNTRRNADLPGNVTPSPVDERYSPDHHLDSPNGTIRKHAGRTGKNQDEVKEPHNPMLTELCTISWLIFFSFWGTLARLGVEAITLYPSTPFPSRVLWANLGGSFVMGFLSEDRRLFREEWGWPTPDASSSERGKVKKTIPLFIGLATGFCGCFTSFSSFIRDAFLALTNALESPSPTSPYHTDPNISSRNGGFSFLALMAVLIVHPAVSMSGLKAGAHFALLLQPITPVLPFRPTLRFLDPLGVVLAFGCWIGAIVISIAPPGDSTTGNDWRSRAALPLVFSPLGCLLRFYASKHLNARIPSFPLGTFTVNIFGTMVLGMAWDLQHARTVGASSNFPCSVLQGIMEGFCGCLTTVSTWVLELQGLRRRHAWVYGLASVVVGLGFMVIIMGSMGWTIGFAKPVCN
jgi:fluoride exporter